MARGRKPLIADRYHCNTLFQFAMISLKEELGCTNSDLAESLGVPTPTFNLWLNAKNFPENEDKFLSLVEQYPTLNKCGGFYKLKEDFNEYKGFSSPRPTKGLIEYCKSIGMTYYKSKGCFEETMTDFEKHKTSQKVSQFKNFVELLPETHGGKMLEELLFKTIGELPKDIDIDISCITDKKRYMEVYDELQRRAEEASKVRSDFLQKMLLLRGLKCSYEELSETILTEKDIEKKENAWKFKQTLLNRCKKEEGI